MQNIDAQLNFYEDLGKMLFLARDDILGAHGILPIGGSENWADLTPEQRTFFRDTAKKQFITVFLSKIEVNGHPIIPKI